MLNYIVVEKNLCILQNMWTDFFWKCDYFRLKSNHMNYWKFSDSEKQKGQEVVLETEGVPKVEEGEQEINFEEIWNLYCLGRICCGIR